MSDISVATMKEDSVLRVLEAYATEVRTFTKDEVGFVQEISELLREAEDTRRRFVFLAEANALLATAIDYSTVLATTTRLSVPTLADCCFIDTIETDGIVHRFAVAYEGPEDAVREIQDRCQLEPNASHGIARVLRTREPELIPHLDDERVWDALPLEILSETKPESYLCVPLLLRRRNLGTISTSPDLHYGPDDLKLAESLAYSAALAIDNAFCHVPEI